MRKKIPTLGLVSLVQLLACKSDPATTPDMGATASRLAVQRVTATVQVADVLRAAIEMQHSGEPLAQTMGRKLAGYDRSSLLTDQYTDPDTMKAMTDVVGYSSAVESYEYSKYMMNTISFESGPGLSLMYGPLINPTNQTGAAALGLLRTRVQALAIASHAGVDATGPWVMVPAPTNNPLNVLGFPGLMPEFAELASFAPDVAPSGNVSRGCSLQGGYGAAAGMAVTVGDYECGYNSLHVDRGPADKTLTLDALGFAAWKQSLWAINYFQIAHDINGDPFTHVADADISNVGKPGNMVVADAGAGMTGAPGTYIGSSDLEGFQGMLMSEAIDNKADFLLKQVAHFPDIASALNYDYTSPLKPFPHSVKVTEVAGSAGSDPQPTNLTVVDATSQLGDLSALIGAYAEAFALTDRRNTDVGGSSTNRPVFDGDPFTSDNGMPDGEATLHDRALGVMKAAIVNLDRMHSYPGSGVLCLSVSGGACTPRTSTLEIAQSIVSLRTAYRSLTAQLTLYGNATPDTTMTTTALDGTSVTGIPGGVTFAARLQQIIKTQADFLSSKLIDADGLAVTEYVLDTNQPDPKATTLESQAAAVRGLLEAYLATSQSAYRDRAEAAYNVLEQRFYESTLRVYRTTLGDDNTFVFTPVRFGTLQAALRQMYVLVGSRAGNEMLRIQIEARLGRLNKLVLNGWDDRNDDGKVDYPAECLRVEATLPRGGLMLGERALTGELGSEMGALTADRDKDCVPEIDDGKLAALLAAEFVLVRK